MKIASILLLLLIVGCRESGNALSIFKDIASSPTSCITKYITLDNEVLMQTVICDQKEFIRRGCALTPKQIENAQNGKPWHER